MYCTVVYCIYANTSTITDMDMYVYMCRAYRLNKQAGKEGKGGKGGPLETKI